MIKNGQSIRIILFLLYASSTVLIGQTKKQESEFYSWFDEIVGVDNSSLFNGIEFKEKFRFLNDNTNYFNTNKFLEGTIIYDGEWFFKVPIKYDAYHQEVIIKFPYRNSGDAIIKLYNSKIDAFSIGNSNFKHITIDSNGPLEISGFYEIVFQNSLLTFYSKHQKIKREITFERTAYSEFIDAKQTHIVLYKNTYYLIKNQKDLAALFSNFKKEIYSDFKNYKTTKKWNFKDFLVNQLSKISSFLLKENMQ